jgi:hypothetical protein
MTPTVTRSIIALHLAFSEYIRTGTNKPNPEAFTEQARPKTCFGCRWAHLRIDAAYCMGCDMFDEFATHPSRWELGFAP